jgi:serine/threonine protein kinase
LLVFRFSLRRSSVERLRPAAVLSNSATEVVKTVQRIGKYQIIASLARGGMGDVYLTVVTGPAGFSKLAVIKALRANLAEEPQFLGMFLEEARLAARLSHRNIVQTNEVGQHDGRYFIAMEYLDGQTLHRLRSRVRRSGDPKIPLETELFVLHELLRALEYAHSLADFDGTPLELVHRDVSPHNVFLTYDGEVKLLDFGIAKATDSEHTTLAGTFKGKVTYMAPEQARGERADRRTDIFAVGVMLAEALSGIRFWSMTSEQNLLQQLANGELPAIRERAPSAPDALLRMCERAIAAKAEDRYPTAGAFRAELEAYLRETYAADLPDARGLAKTLNDVFGGDRTRARSALDLELRSLKTKCGDHDARAEAEPATASLAPLALDSGEHPETGKAGEPGSAEAETRVSKTSHKRKVAVASAGLLVLVLAAFTVPSVRPLPFATDAAEHFPPTALISEELPSPTPASAEKPQHSPCIAAPIVPRHRRPRGASSLSAKRAPAAQATPMRPVRPIDKDDPYK